MSKYQKETHDICATSVRKILTHDTKNNVATRQNPLKAVNFSRTTKKTQILESKAKIKLTSVVQKEKRQRQIREDSAKARDLL